MVCVTAFSQFVLSSRAVRRGGGGAVTAGARKRERECSPSARRALADSASWDVLICAQFVRVIVATCERTRPAYACLPPAPADSARGGGDRDREPTGRKTNPTASRVCTRRTVVVGACDVVSVGAFAGAGRRAFAHPPPPPLRALAANITCTAPFCTSSRCARCAALSTAYCVSR